jgi:micrococcal nuclease
MKHMRAYKRHYSIAGIVLAIVFGVLQYTHTLKLGGGMPIPAGTYAIDHFIDGDTIAVKMNGTVEPVRFIGVDTPETHKPNTPVQCYGPAAAAFTKQQIGSQRVRLVADAQSTDRDRYNRLLRYVYLPNGTLLDQALVAGGYGFAYVQFPFTKSASFTQSQADAQSNHKGLWGNCNPYQETSGRWQTQNASAGET